MLAALVGALVERVGMLAAFPEPGEFADAAIERVKPIAAILLDAETGDAESDLFLARAKRRHFPILMFGPKSAIEQRRAWLRDNDVLGYALPSEIEILQAALERIARGEAPKAPAPRKKRPSVELMENGTLLYCDELGTRWSVYDRRGQDRRIQRRFVSDAGDVRSCDIPDTEAASNTPDELSKQIARASRVTES